MPNINEKRFNNPICKECIKQSYRKYKKFDCKCDGIMVEDYVKESIKQGLDEDTARWLFDPVYFFETIYGHKARWYQPRILLCTSRNLVGRQCRQTGKTLMFMYKIFHYIMTHKNKTVLVVTPQEVQIKKIWDEYIFRDFVYKNETVKASVVAKSQSPSYKVEFDNGSKIILMIAGEGARGTTADWIYMDEAAIIPKDSLTSILLTIASRGDNATILMTSTPKGRGNAFYDACRENSDFNEYHVSIEQVEEMRGQEAKFLKMLGETEYIQDCKAEFPETSGGPFNYRGIDLAKQKYEYGSIRGREDGWMYFGGVDWNGPGIGTYFYIVGLHPDKYHVKVVDKRVVSSAMWNSTVAISTFKELNRKWEPKNWMCDAGYGHSMIEELRRWSTFDLPAGLPPNHPDAMVKHITAPVPFGEWTIIDDPFTGDEIKKTTKSFLVAQVARLFEPQTLYGEDFVPIMFSEEDEELIKSLENYKLLTITDKGTEKYGFDKKDGIEDHAIDAFILAVYGIVKNYSELFNRILASSVPIHGREILGAKTDVDVNSRIPVGSSIVLLTDNSSGPMYLDEKAWKEPEEETNTAFISRTFTKSGTPRRVDTRFKRNSYVVKRTLDF